MKLGVMLEVDETFTIIWLSRSSEVRVKVRRWPHSPFGTIFLLLGLPWTNKHQCTPAQARHHLGLHGQPSMRPHLLV